jgi:hypothetical protein
MARGFLTSLVLSAPLALLLVAGCEKKQPKPQTDDSLRVTKDAEKLKRFKRQTPGFGGGGGPAPAGADKAGGKGAKKDENQKDGKPAADKAKPNGDGK